MSAALRRMLGPDVGIGITNPIAPSGGLWPQETIAMTRAVPKRLYEFTAGRNAAREAMADLGVSPAAIPVGKDRAPIWPAGLSGSITHCPQWCIAAVARLADYKALGIDVEPATRLDEELVDIICTSAENEWRTRQPDPLLAAKMIFSAKEAVYKAQYPLTGAVIGFDAMTLDITEKGLFITSVPHVRSIKGAIALHDGMILSCAYV